MKNSITSSILRILLVFGTIAVSYHSSSGKTYSSGLKDTIDKEDIGRNLKNTSSLLYPLTTRRLYAETGNKAMWLFPESSSEDINQALLLLNCAVRYGLDNRDYHPNDFTISTIKKFAEEYNPRAAARFDVMLTDAMLAFISDLHFGRQNPTFKANQIDAPGFKGAKIDSVLKKAFRSGRFMSAIEDAQPVIKEYRDLQRFLSLVTGQYYGEVQNETIQRVIINLERWRWETPENNAFALINIPGGNLRYYQNNSYQEFRVIVGKSSAPSPVLSASIAGFTTHPKKFSDKIFKEIAPSPELPNLTRNNPGRGDIMVPRIKNIDDVTGNQPDQCIEGLGSILFSFRGNPNIFLHARPEKGFRESFNGGCILIERAEDFAELLLKTDSASHNTLSRFHRSIARARNKDFILRTPISAYTRYFTCEIKKDDFIEYEDIYRKDDDLFKKLFRSEDSSEVKIQEFMKKAGTEFNYIKFSWSGTEKDLKKNSNVH